MLAFYCFIPCDWKISFFFTPTINLPESLVQRDTDVIKVGVVCVTTNVMRSIFLSRTMLQVENSL